LGLKNTIGTKKMTFEKNGWILAGLIWGGIMFFTMDYAVPLLRGVEEAKHSIAIDIASWTLVGLVWGYFMKRHMMKQAAKNRK
jgi:hypothetical protein